MINYESHYSFSPYRRYTPLDTFRFRDYPFRYCAAWVCWNLGVLIEDIGILLTKLGESNRE